MKTKTPATYTKPEDVLPDEFDRAEFDGVTVRKGTIAAFLQNANQWLDSTKSDEERKILEEGLVLMVPALRALGVFGIFEASDRRLADLIARS